LWPAAFSFAPAAATSPQVFGGLFGSRPAALKASLFQKNTVVELLKGNDTMSPFGEV
jgi:hypothetical protein